MPHSKILMNVNLRSPLASALILATAAVATSEPIQDFIQSADNQDLARDLVLVATGGVIVAKGMKMCVSQPDVILDWS